MRLNANALLMLLWTLLLTGCSLVFSFQFTSFLYAKDLLLAVGVMGVSVIHCIKGRQNARGFFFFAPLWMGLLFWTASGFFTARVLSFHVEKMTHLALMLYAASLAAGVFHYPGGRRWLWNGLIASGGVMAALALLQYAGWMPWLMPAFPGYNQPAYSVFGNQNLLGGYLAFTLALLTHIAVREHISGIHKWVVGIVRIALFTVMVGGLIVSSTRSAWLAAASGGLYALLSSDLPIRPRQAFRRWARNGFLFILIAVIALIVATSPLTKERLQGTLTDQDVGGRARIWFWAGALHMLAAHPALGVGLGNYNYWSPYYQAEALQGPWGRYLYHNELHTLHAHSEPLEWMAETGLLGSVFLLWFGMRILKRRPHRHPETSGIIALAIFACFNTFIHSNPHVLAVLLLSAMMGLGPKPSFAAASEMEPVAHGKGRRRNGWHAKEALFPLFAMLLTAGLLFTSLLPSAQQCAAEQTHVQGGLAEPLYLHALSRPWPNYHARESYAILLLDEGRFEEAEQQLAAASHGIDTGRIHLLRAICAEALGNAQKTEEHLRHCLARWPANAHALSLLNKTPNRGF